jgi:heme/copper-type cytochrome/quinol oxidase subunit 4
MFGVFFRYDTHLRFAAFLVLTRLAVFLVMNQHRSTDSYAARTTIAFIQAGTQIFLQTFIAVAEKLYNY